MRTVSQKVIDKGQRLFDAGHVIHGPVDREYRVKGDSGFYKVTIFDITDLGVEGTCTCPAYGGCSHLFATALFVQVNNELPVKEAQSTEDLFRSIV